MWILKLSLTTLWMAGIVSGATFGGLLHLLALAAVALVLIEETPYESRFASRVRFARPRSRRDAPRYGVVASLDLGRNITHVSSVSETRAWPSRR